MFAQWLSLCSDWHSWRDFFLDWMLYPHGYNSGDEAPGICVLQIWCRYLAFSAFFHRRVARRTALEVEG